MTTGETTKKSFFGVNEFGIGIRDGDDVRGGGGLDNIAAVEFPSVRPTVLAFGEEFLLWKFPSDFC